MGGGGVGKTAREREREKEAEGHLCNQPQPDTSAVITETLKNLHLAFKSLIREPLKGRLKSKTDHQTLKVCLKVSGKSARRSAPGARPTKEARRICHRRRVLAHLKWSAV